MKVFLDYEPTPKQRLFHNSKADEVLFGGAAGGGKSKAVVMDALFRCMKWPNTHAYIFRRTYRELEDSIIKEARLSIPNILGRYNSGRHEYHLINGSYIHFRHCESVKDMYQYKGQEIQWLYFDELTTFEYEIYDFLKTRLRAKKSLNMVPLVRCTSNPGDIGHAWVKAHFVDAGPFMKLVPHEYYSETLHKSYTRTTQYIPAFAKENPHISEEYILELEKKPEALRKALLYGEWDAFEGQVFTEFRNDPAHYIDGKNTHVISPFPLNPNWQRYCTFDFGFSKPFAVLWFAQKPDGTLILYREWYGYTGVPNEGVKMTPESIAKGILAREQEEHKEGIHFTRYADPACWDVSRGDSVADQMRRVGVNWNPSDHSRISGKLQIHSRLAFGEDGRPMLQIFSTCPQVIRTLPALPYSRTKPEDIDTDSEDHIYDAIRYLCVMHPTPKRIDPAPVVRGYDPLSRD